MPGKDSGGRQVNGGGGVRANDQLIGSDGVTAAAEFELHTGTYPEDREPGKNVGGKGDWPTAPAGWLRSRVIRAQSDRAVGRYLPITATPSYFDPLPANDQMHAQVWGSVIVTPCQHDTVDANPLDLSAATGKERRLDSAEQASIAVEKGIAHGLCRWDCVVLDPGDVVRSGLNGAINRQLFTHGWTGSETSPDGGPSHLRRDRDPPGLPAHNL